MQERLAVYAGTLDILTFGHLWLIERAARMFDKLVVAVGANAEKKCLFEPRERLAMLRDCTRQFPNVLAEMFTNQFLVDYARAANIPYMVRGIRSESDYEYERTMRNVNEDFDPTITTIFLIPPRALAEVSSSFVRGLIGPEGWEHKVSRYVPAPVLERIKEVHRGGAL